MGKNATKKATAVGCPKCGAYKGMPCRAGSGYGEPHPARVEAVKSAYGTSFEAARGVGEMDAEA